MSQKYKPNTRLNRGRTSIVIQEDENERYLHLNYISFFEIFLMGFPMLIYLVVNYFGRDSYGNFAMLLIGLGSIALIAVLIVQKSKILKLQNYYLENEDQLLMWVLWVAVSFAVLGYIWYLMGALLKYSLSPTELYFYYIGAAIMEECLFRFCICGILKTKVFNQTKLSNGLQNLIIAIISAITFMLSHISTYGTSPTAMASVLFGGLIFALVYLKTKDISITITVHIFINIIATANLIMMSGGI